MNAQITIPIVAAIAGTFFGFLLQRLFEKRSKLSTFIGHMAEFSLPDQKLNLRTHSIVISNPGKLARNNVRICHALLPDYFQVTPAAKYNIEKLLDGGRDIIFSKIISGEQVTISYLYFAPLSFEHIHRGVKSDEGFAKVINVLPQRQFSKFLQLISLFILIIGFGTLTYWFIKIISIIMAAVK